MDTVNPAAVDDAAIWRAVQAAKAAAAAGRMSESEQLLVSAAQRAPDRAIVMITHYQRLLDYIEPDHVHVLSGGKIVMSGDKSLATELEKRGYAMLCDAAA